MSGLIHPSLTQIAERIAEEEDVDRVIAVVPKGDDRVRYMIETPFNTWPRYVIGSATKDLLQVHFEFRCGEEWNIIDVWNKLEPEHRIEGILT